MEPVSVVIPTLNEAGSIGSVIREIPAAYAGDIIVADSGSQDGTARIAREAGRGSSTEDAATAVPVPAVSLPPIRRAASSSSWMATAPIVAT
ncbi:glycosyltransferase [Methylobacterium komagatae]|uniref:Glycosyltransferase n=1 Tax=Methylobacterium komagatae TaxID=374425 RepID=A0ABW2BQV5_9HYPH